MTQMNIEDSYHAYLYVFSIYIENYFSITATTER